MKEFIGLRHVAMQCMSCITLAHEYGWFCSASLCATDMDVLTCVIMSFLARPSVQSNCWTSGVTEAVQSPVEPKQTMQSAATTIHLLLFVPVQVPNADTLEPGTLPCIQSLWNTTEDHIQRLVQHYNVHSVSFRNRFWPEIDAEADGFTPDVLFMHDEIHPSERGVHLLGGLILDFLQQALRKALAQGFQSKPEENTPVSGPLFVSASDEAKASQCNRGGALQDMVLYSYGWTWVDGKKPGFQSDEILTSLFLSVPMDSVTSNQISVGYLSSYENMGIARVSCVGACQCEGMDIDATSKSHASQEHNALIPFQHAKDSKGCILKVDNMNWTHAANEGHRFKISSVVVVEREAARLVL